MRLVRLVSVLPAFFAAVAAQFVSGLTFDARDVVSLMWAFEGAVSTRYDLWLCAGDETTGAYVSGAILTFVDWTKQRLTFSIYTGYLSASH